MINRTQRILLMLVNAKSPLTSGKIAAGVGVSSRTVKSDMPLVAAELADNGARLESRQNLGYFIEITDASDYQPFVDKLSLQSIHIAIGGYDNAERLLYICRKLVASPSGARVDQIADDLCLSRSAIREPLREAYAFCESFHLEVVPTTGHGICVRGSEHLIRMAMTELFETHFHKAVLDKVDQEYARWIWCPYQERQDIRHTFLGCLRGSGWSLRDSITQRMSMYLVIARNRMRAGLRVDIPDSWVSDIRETPLYHLAGVIFDELSSKFDGFDVDEKEVAFLGMRLLCDLDMTAVQDLRPVAPFIYDDVVATTESAMRKMPARLGIDLSLIPGASDLLMRTLLPMLLGYRFGMDGCMRFDYESEKECLKSPLCAYLACVFEEIVSSAVGLCFSESDAALFSTLIAGLLAEVHYDVRPLRLLVVSTVGVGLARIEGDRLRKTFPGLVESIRPCGLYEIRGFDEKDYDAVLIDVDRFGYNYSYPVATYMSNAQGMDFGRIHDDILVDAYQTGGLLPPAECVHVISGALITSPEQFFQVLALRHTKGERLRALMEKRLARDDRMLQLSGASHAAFVIDACNVSDGQVIEVYELDRAIKWHGQKVDRLVYGCLFFGGDLRRLKACERVFSFLASSEDVFRRFLEAPGPCMNDLLRFSLMIAKDPRE